MGDPSWQLPAGRAPRLLSLLFSLLSGLLPGVLAATHIAGLIFFINPHLPFSASPFLNTVLFYSSILAPISLLLLVLITAVQKQSMGQWFPIALTAVMVSGALMFWTHAYYFGFYLPPGINKRLLKAAVFLSLAAVIGFYTLLIHRMRRRRYGQRALAIFGLLALASIYVVVERREAYRPAVEPQPRTITLENQRHPLLCVVGIDSATFDVILPLAEQGNLPFFRRALDEGAQARIPPLEPVRPNPLWTTLITGKYPYKHGIVSDSKYRPFFLDPGLPSSFLNLYPIAVGFKYWGLWGEESTINRQDMRALPLWDLLTRLGMSTALIGWPVTEPTSPEIAINVSPRFFESRASDLKSAYPLDMLERAKLFKTTARSLSPDDLSRFGADPPPVVARSLAKDRWRGDFASFLVQQESAIDALFLHLPGLRNVSESFFGGYSAVQFKGLQDPESVEASRLLAAYYAEIDGFLGRFVDSIDRPTLMIIVSVHGVGRITGLSEVQRWMRRQPATHGDLDDGAQGLLIFMGAGVQKTESVRTAELVDLAPTLLYGLGLPVARDLDGRVQVEFFAPSFMARHPLTFVPSYEAFSATPVISAAPESQD